MPGRKFMLTYQEALTALRNLAMTKALETEIISLEKALNRVLSEDIFSPEDVPSFDNSAMDGFAICYEQVLKAEPNHPIQLEVIGTIGAGDFAEMVEAKSGGCLEIMTGGPVPEGYNAVVKMEDVKYRQDIKTGPKTIQIQHPVAQYENIRFKGEDYKIGDPLLSRATILMPEHIMALATLGQAQVSVYKKPKIVVISTGKELVPYSTKKLGLSQIRNASGVFLTHFFNQMGCEAEFAGIVPDEPKDFFDLIEKIEVTRPDIIVTTGAVSMGKYDFVKSSLADLGAEILFHKVSIRPGKPILFARMRSGAAFFGLPGNPISTAVGARFFLTPYLRSLLKQKPESPLKVNLAKKTKKPEGFRCFLKAQVNLAEHRGAGLPEQASFRVSPFTKSNAWIVLLEVGSQVQQDTEVEVYPLYPLQYNWGNS